MIKKTPRFILACMMLASVISARAQDLVLDSTAVLHVASGETLSVQGNVTVKTSGGIQGTGTLVLNGSSSQQISGSTSVTSSVLPALQIANTKGVKSSIDLTLNGPLTLNDTILSMQNGKVLNAQTYSITRGRGFIDGALKRSFNGASSNTQLFPVGKFSYYLPVTVVLNSASTNSLTVSADSNVAASYPSALSSTKRVKANWVLTNDGSLPNYTATYTIPTALLQGNASIASLNASVNSNSTWSSAISSSSTTANSATFAQTSFGTVQLGETGAIVVNIKALLEGFYAGSGKMAPVLANSGIGSSAVLTDTLTLELRNSTSPYSLVGVQNAVLDTGGNGTFTFSNVSAGTYYLVAKHRNHLATWSANAVAVSGTTSYNFTNASSQAFGDNMKQVGTNLYAFYAGDVNQDGYVDVFDYPDLDTDNNNFNGGYLKTDVNGDGYTDVFDYPLINANNNNFIGINGPGIKCEKVFKIKGY